MDTYRELLQFLHFTAPVSRAEIGECISFTGSTAPLKRILASGVQNGDIQTIGAGKAVRYSLTAKTHLLTPVSQDTYFARDIDERQVQTGFYFSLIIADANPTRADMTK